MIVLYIAGGIILALVLDGVFLLILDMRYYKRVDKEKDIDSRIKEEERNCRNSATKYTGKEKTQSQ